MELAYPPNSQSALSSLNPSISIRSSAAVRSLTLALGVTGLLLFGMSQLIATDLEAPPTEAPPKVAPIHMPDVKPTVYQQKTLQKPQELPPPAAPASVEPVVGPGTIPLDISPPITTRTGVNTAIISADPLPIYKPAPRYPRRAMARGIEGYVVVEFTISKSGSVKNPRVVGGFDVTGVPTGVFDRSALNAVARFKYRPTMVDGKPIEKHGVRNRISYKLAE
ncbi:energy transducer TonB [Microbulbifer elongatus]|uniref:energy transducer TonB n=1 Tax=Microbulbifer elongatus TaxID=86173 RepID=UPI001F4B3FB0|nr:energy transducer TonB [Microbulbifer elongatus]